MIAALIQKVDAAQTWHNSLTDRQWLQPLSGRWYVIAVIIATSIAAYMNYYVRASQYDIWQQNPEIFALDDGTQLFTTTDALELMTILFCPKLNIINRFSFELPYTSVDTSSL